MWDREHEGGSPLMQAKVSKKDETGGIFQGENAMSVSEMSAGGRKNDLRLRCPPVHAGLREIAGCRYAVQWHPVLWARGVRYFL